METWKGHIVWGGFFLFWHFSYSASNIFRKKISIDNYCIVLLECCLNFQYSVPILINCPKILIEGFQISNLTNPKQILILFFLIMGKPQQIIQCFMQSRSFWIKRMSHLFTTFPCASKVQVNNMNVFKCLSVGEEDELEGGVKRAISLESLSQETQVPPSINSVDPYLASI